jgi:hypothetical protein
MNLWYESRANVIEAVERGAATVDRLNGPTLGPTTFSSIDYPEIQVLPESMDQQDGNEYVHTIRLNCFFQRSRGVSYLDHLRAAMDATQAALDEVRDVDCVYSFVPTSIEDFAGESDADALLLISVQLQIATLIDLADV